MRLQRIALGAPDEELVVYVPHVGSFARELAEGSVDASFVERGAVEAPVIEGLGGYRVMAPQEEVAEARATLKALRTSPGLSTGDDEPPWGAPTAAAASYQARAKGMRVIAMLFLGAPVIVWLGTIRKSVSPA